MLVATAQEELGCAERSRRQDDPLAPLVARDQSPPFDSIEGDPVASPIRPDRSHEVERSDLGPTLLGRGNVIEVERVLGTNFTADIAVPQMNARSLLLPLGVDKGLAVLFTLRVGQVVVPGRIKRQGQRHAREPVGEPGPLGRLLH